MHVRWSNIDLWGHRHLYRRHAVIGETNLIGCVRQTPDDLQVERSTFNINRGHGMILALSVSASACRHLGTATVCGVEC